MRGFAIAGIRLKGKRNEWGWLFVIAERRNKLDVELKCFFFVDAVQSFESKISKFCQIQVDQIANI